MIKGISLLAASVHDEVSAAEHATLLFEPCSLVSASVCDGVSCAFVRREELLQTTKKKTMRNRMSG
jgi:hypothetical protein